MVENAEKELEESFANYHTESGKLTNISLNVIKALKTTKNALIPNKKLDALADKLEDKIKDSFAMLRTKT
jgi:hypothetical protein